MPPVGGMPQVEPSRHFLGNLLQGVVGFFAMAIPFVGLPIGAYLMADALCDVASRRSIWGLLTGSDSRSFGAQIMEGLWPTNPRRAGYQMRAPA